MLGILVITSTTRPVLCNDLPHLTNGITYLKRYCYAIYFINYVVYCIDEEQPGPSGLQRSSHGMYA